MDPPAFYTIPNTPRASTASGQQQQPKRYHSPMQADSSWVPYPLSAVENQVLPSNQLPSNSYPCYVPAEAQEAPRNAMPPNAGLGHSIVSPPPTYNGTGFVNQQQYLHSPRFARGAGAPENFLITDQYYDHTHVHTSHFSNAPWPTQGPATADAMESDDGDQNQLGLVMHDFDQWLNGLDQRQQAQRRPRADQTAGHVLGDPNASAHDLNEGPPIDLNDPIFDFFDNTNGIADTGGDTSGLPMLAAPLQTTRFQQYAPDDARPAIVGEVPYTVAPVAPMHASRSNVEGQPQIPNAAESSASQPRGKLAFQKVDMGACEWISSYGKKCGRTAPVYQVFNGPSERCCMCLSKHMPQWKRQHALPPFFRIIPKTLNEALQDIYPDHEPLKSDSVLEDVSLAIEGGQPVKWQTRFIQAALTPYDGDTQKLRAQQNYFNGNVECDPDGFYEDDNVNSRMALLFYAAYNTQTGGKRLYARNGDSTGYPKESEPLTFLKRLETIEELLKENKRIVMDVIQGRGVIALVSNPLAYHRRKATNNANNDLKRKDRDDDDDEASEDGNDEHPQSPMLPPPKKKPRTTRQPASQVKKDLKAKEKLQDAGYVEHKQSINPPPAQAAGSAPPAFGYGLPSVTNPEPAGVPVDRKPTIRERRALRQFQQSGGMAESPLPSDPGLFQGWDFLEPGQGL